jgi:hypothetical protein
MASYPINWGEVHERLLAGEAMSSIAAEYGVSESAIGVHAHRHGWKITEARREVLGQKAMIWEAGAVSEELKGASTRTRLGLSEQVERILKELKGTEISVLLRARVLAAVVPVAKVLYGWQTPEEEYRKNAGGAINIALIRCSPQELRRRRELMIGEGRAKDRVEGSKEKAVEAREG